MGEVTTFRYRWGLSSVVSALTAVASIAMVAYSPVFVSLLMTTVIVALSARLVAPGSFSKVRVGNGFVELHYPLGWRKPWRIDAQELKAAWWRYDFLGSVLGLETRDGRHVEFEFKRWRRADRPDSDTALLDAVSAWIDVPRLEDAEARKKIVSRSAWSEELSFGRHGRHFAWLLLGVLTLLIVSCAPTLEWEIFGDDPMGLVGILAGAVLFLVATGALILGGTSPVLAFAIGAGFWLLSLFLFAVMARLGSITFGEDRELLLRLDEQNQWRQVWKPLSPDVPALIVEAKPERRHHSRLGDEIELKVREGWFGQYLVSNRELFKLRR